MSEVKTPEEMYYEWRQTFDESLDENMCAGKPFLPITIDLSMTVFLAGYQAGRLNSEGVQAAKDQVADVGKVMPQWISVKDRLPEEGEEIFWCHAPTSEMAVGQLVVAPPYFTHWMPLPSVEGLKHED